MTSARQTTGEAPIRGAEESSRLSAIQGYVGGYRPWRYSPHRPQGTLPEYRGSCKAREFDKTVGGLMRGYKSIWDRMKSGTALCFGGEATAVNTYHSKQLPNPPWLRS